MHIISLAVICHQLPTIVGATSDVTLPKTWKLGDTVRLTCNNKLRFQNGTIMKYFQCIDADTWSDSKANCRGNNYPIILRLKISPFIGNVLTSH